jgi:hypothetical protein
LSGEQAMKLKQIGPKIAKRVGRCCWKSGRLSPFLQILIPAVQIDEIIKNGGISDRERLEDNPRARTIAAFADVYGVGPLKANELWNDGARR